MGPCARVAVGHPRLRIDGEYRLTAAGSGRQRETHGDAEGLRIVQKDGQETALVSFEQKAAVRHYTGPDFASDVPSHPALPKFVTGLRRNQGLESVAVAPAASPLAGATVAIAERSLDSKGNHRGFILDGASPGQFQIVRSEDFDVSDANFLPNGDLLILEWRFSFSGGFAMLVGGEGVPLVPLIATGICFAALVMFTEAVTRRNRIQRRIDDVDAKVEAALGAVLFPVAT